MADLSRETLQRLARLGAQQRLEELRREEAAIRAAFPGLGRGTAARGGRGRPAAAEGASPAKRRRRRYKMSAAQKKAVSERMKKYWASRRKAKG